MAASLSEDEFQRMQAQLIELRSTNYALDERCQKLSSELSVVRNQNELLDKEYTKVQKAFTKSKKAQDVEQLLQENDNLQRKLQNQEDEFRLQNTTLMQELMRLDSTNEELKKDLEKLKTSPGEIFSASDQEDLRRLQAENLALQKSLSDSRNTFEKELGALKLARVHNDSEESNLDATEKSNSLEAILSQQSQELNETKLKLYTETEEKNILRDQLASLEASMKGDINRLQEECQKQSDRLKKKQESILQLQEEKESLFTDNKRSMENFLQEKTQETEKANEQILKLQTHVNQTQQAMQELRNTSDTTIKSLNLQLTSAKDEILQQSEKIIQDMQSRCESLELEIDVLKTSLEENRTEHQLLQCHFEDAQSSLKNLKDEFKVCEEQRAKFEEAAGEAKKSAEKRKALLDNMAIHLQETSDKHNIQMNKMEAELRNQIASIQIELDLEKEKNRSFSQLQNSFKSQEVILSSIEASNLDLRHALERERESARKSNERSLEETEIREQEQEAALLQIKLDHSQEIVLLTAQLEELRSQTSIFESQVEKLKQEIKDGVEERKIQEKKGLSMVKELKKQLVGERRRGDRLQERLQEILSDTSSGKIEDILPVGNLHDKPKGDASSVSSWSFMSSHLDNSKESTEDPDNRISSHEGSPNGTNDNEYNDLLQRVAALQQEKWILEEKLNHLEESNAAMVEDIMAKTAVIQFYCMEGRPDSRGHSPVSQKLTVKRVVDFIKDKGDENLRDINRKLQRMLEETLTKNMYLQKDLENMSNQLVQVSKVVGSNIQCDPVPDSTVFSSEDSST